MKHKKLPTAPIRCFDTPDVCVVNMPPAFDGVVRYSLREPGEIRIRVLRGKRDTDYYSDK